MKFEDIREGDTIRMVIEVEVTRVEPDVIVTKNHGTYSKPYIDGAWARSPENVELVNRPINLPTKPGSVIRVFSYMGEAIWLRQENGFWVSQGSNQRNDEALKTLIGSKSDRDFEVIH